MTHPVEEPPETMEWSQRRFFESLRPGQMMEALFEAVPGAYYFIKDRDSRFMGGSRQFAERLAGTNSLDAMIGKTDHDFSAEFLADAFLADDREVMETGKPILNRIELVPTADGSLDWLSTTKIPLYGIDGDIVGLAGVTRRIRDSDAVYADHPEMHRIVDFVREHYREKLSVADMARVGGVSVSSQERLFKKTFGLTPSMYLRKTRLNAACRLLRDSDNSLSDIAIQCGFNDQNSMTRAFRLELKITPLKYRRRFSEATGERNRTRRKVG